MPRYVLEDDPQEKPERYVLEDTAAARQYASDKEQYDPMKDMSAFDKLAAGTGKAVSDVGQGIGQILRLTNRDDVKETRQRDAALMESGWAKGGNLLGNALMIAPTAMIPGAATIPGAGTIGAITGLFQPSESTKETAINTGLGAAAGAGGQWAANKVGGWLSSRLASKQAEQAANQSRNSVKDAALAEGRAAGYVVPKSEVAPSTGSNVLESFGGKAAVRQEASIRNQQTTNALTRKAIGLSDDAPLSQGALDTLRKTAGKTYKEVSDLSPQAASDLEALKVARSEATGWFAAYNRSARPDDLATAKAAREAADNLENWIEYHAANAGRQDLLPALKDARKLIAKTYTVERALNKGSGDIDARVLGRMFDKGKPLSDGLDTVGRFNQAYPKFTGPAPSTMAPGVNYLDAISMPVLGAAGAAVTGNPAGLLAAGMPLLRGPARSLALSKAMQSVPEYGVGAMTRASGRLTPEMLGLLPRMGIPYGGLLSAE